MKKKLQFAKIAFTSATCLFCNLIIYILLFYLWSLLHIKIARFMLTILHLD